MRWRFLELEIADGPSNMATDEAILEVMTREALPPTLRFYGWSGNYLSLGSAETAKDVDLTACRKHGIRVLRRGSGGTAVLHQAQLAFSLIASEKHPVMTGQIHDSYRQLGRPVLRTLQNLGIDAWAIENDEAKALKQSADQRWNAACLASLVAYEILHGRRKIAAHAQIRRRNVVLHHCVILLDFDANLMADCLATDSKEEKSLLVDYLGEKVSSCREVLGQPPQIEDLSEALRRAFVHTFEVDLSPEELTDEEKALSSRLLETKYHNDAWTFRR